MKCQSCGKSTNINWGDANTALCQSCADISAETHQPSEPKTQIDNEQNQDISIFSFEGRIKRSTFWPMFISLLIVSAVVYFGLTYASLASTNENIVSTIAILDLIYTFAATWVLLATYVKRLHDLDKSGWIVLIILIPLVGLLLILYLGFAPGSSGVNKYGEKAI